MPKGSRKAAGGKPKVNAVIEAKIPQKSSGKFVEATARLVNAGANAVEAITDIVRPLTEWAGLRGDRLRLQREEVALEIARRAGDRIKAQNAPRIPIPTKTVVRLLESGSLEEPTDNTMIEMWANLLASAAHDPSAATPRFISILEDLNGLQAKHLHDVLLGKVQIQQSPKDAPIVFEAPLSERELIRTTVDMTADSCLRKIEKQIQEYRGKGALDQITASVIDQSTASVKRLLARPGVAVETFSLFFSTEKNAYPDGGVFKDTRTSRTAVDAAILASMGLLSKEKVGPIPITSDDISVKLTFSFFRVTSLCLSFMHAVNPDLISWDAETLEQKINREDAMMNAVERAAKSRGD